VFISLGGILFVIGFTMGAEQEKLNIGLITYMRGVSTCLFNWLIITSRGEILSFFNEKHFSLLNTRSIYCTLQGLAIASALYYVPPPIVHTIGASAPVAVFVIDYLRNGVPVTTKQIYGIVICCTGLLITINA
jgi:drug/metabolite transporter (DMT)-like permease